MLTFSTDKVRAADRPAYWADVVCAQLIEADCDVGMHNLAFAGHLDQERFGRVAVSHVASGAQRVRRERRHIARSNQEQLLLCLQRTGCAHVRQGGHASRLLPGDMTFITSASPYDVEFQGAFEQTLILLPRLAMTLPCDLDAACGMRGSVGELGVALHALCDARVESSGPAAAHLGAAIEHLAAHCVARLVQGVGRPAESCGVDVACAAKALLTEQQLRVLQQLVDGRCNKEIMRELKLAEGTVKAHLRAIFERLGVRSRVQAAVRAQGLGLHSRRGP